MELTQLEDVFTSEHVEIISLEEVRGDTGDGRQDVTNVQSTTLVSGKDRGITSE